jgi:Na+-translocating ferredoxin:NAD+ oxidoreductase RnfG subunit
MRMDLIIVKRILTLGTLSLVPLAIVAHAEVYMTDEAAVQSIFPAAQVSPAAASSPGAPNVKGKFVRKELTLSSDQIAVIEKNSGEKVYNPKLTFFENGTKDIVFIDQVLGKHEFITIAVGINHNGSVQGIQVLEYRETYGSQVRGPEWRKQFVGKTTASELKIGSDIKNISGATLSSVHITAGVRRLVRTYDNIQAQL